MYVGECVCLKALIVLIRSTAQDFGQATFLLEAPRLLSPYLSLSLSLPACLSFFFIPLLLSVEAVCLS